MQIALVEIEGVTPYSASRVIDPIATPKLAKENHEDYEMRTWRERLGVDSSGRGVISAQAFKNCLDVAAARYAGKIPGQGNTTYKKFFECGLLVSEDLDLGVTREKVEGERLFVPSDGVKGSGKRVWKVFPVVRKWGGIITVHVLEDTITREVFTRVAKQAFSFVGLGRWRPERGGSYGRAVVKTITWEES